MVEGRLTNENVFVRLTQSCPMDEAVSDSFTLRQAEMHIICDDGHVENLVYSDSIDCYVSPTGFVGTPGHTYTLAIELDSHHYEGHSTMPHLAPITETQFRWLDIKSARILHYDMQAIDPQPDTMNYYWYRMLRGQEVYRWNAVDDRGCPDGLFVRDIICMVEGMAREDNKQYHDRVLYEGDTIRLELMTIDQPTYDYLQSLLLSGQTTANPITNMKGGCHGFFTAASLTHAPMVIFRYEDVLTE